MAESKGQDQRSIEGAIISAAGDMARAGRHDFEGIVTTLEGAGYKQARQLLSKPHLKEGIERILLGARVSQ